MPSPRIAYSDELANRIIDRLPAEPLTVILRDKGMPHYSTVMGWVREHPEFGENYARAREDQGDYDADTVNEIRQQVMTGDIPPDVGRVAIDACKWTAGIRKPKVYGNKLALEHTGRVRTTREMTDAELETIARSDPTLIGSDHASIGSAGTDTTPSGPFIVRDVL